MTNRKEHTLNLIDRYSKELVDVATRNIFRIGITDRDREDWLKHKLTALCERLKRIEAEENPNNGESHMTLQEEIDLNTEALKKLHSDLKGAKGHGSVYDFPEEVERIEREIHERTMMAVALYAKQQHINRER